MKHNIRDVIIIGLGITGAAELKIVSQYTNAQKITVLEKYERAATVNSNALNNAQTSHDGSTETNYSLEHALDVKWPADMLRNYLEQIKDPTLFQITNRSSLALGDGQVERLRQRYEEFKPHYSDLSFYDRRSDLIKIEPNVIKGRNENEAVAMMVSNKGYAVNYQRAAEYMIDDAIATKKDIEIYTSTEVGKVKYENGIFTLQTTKGEMRSRFLLVAAGAYSLKFAQELGYGEEFTIFPVAGSFVVSPYVLYGKVYPMAEGGNPWAVIHGDPDILDPKITRWGPTTKPIPMMERHHYQTIKDYLNMGILTWPGIRSSLKVIRDEKLLGYLLKNELYDVPGIGMHLFHKEVQRIVPLMERHQLQLRRGAGGLRPQLVNMILGKLIMGDSLIQGVNSIFNTTPSPGASVCMGNGFRDARFFAQSTGFDFDEARMLADLNMAPRNIKYEAMHSAV